MFARPGKFIWTYQKPYEQVLQADGDQLYIYDKDLNQVTVKQTGQRARFVAGRDPVRQQRPGKELHAAAKRASATAWNG